MFFRRNVRRAFVHQVLKQMREARVAGFFVLRANVIPHLQIDHRRSVIFQHDDAQAVRKFVRNHM
jgi:hypothetical protein